MAGYLKAIAYILIVLVLYLLLSGHNKNMALLLSVVACCGVIAVCVEYLQPVLAFWDKLTAQGNWDPQFMEILLKAVGLGLICEYVCLLCADAGNSALGRSLQFLTSAIILWISLPLFSSLLDMLNDILDVS